MIEKVESLKNTSSTTLGISKELCDDDGRPQRTGTVWTTSSHIITAVIGSGVLSLAWSIAQLGWIAGPIIMIFFSLVTLYTSYFLAKCYRAGDPITGKRSYTYMEAIGNILGGKNVYFCGIIQYANLYGTTIGYTIGASLSMMAITKIHCIYSSEGKDPCIIYGNRYLMGFGIIQLGFSQLPDFHNISWLSILAAVMSFTYSIIGLILGIIKMAENGTVMGNIAGAKGELPIDKVWGIFLALGNIAFAYSYSFILIEIQDTIKSPFELKTMMFATRISIATTTTFYVLCGCIGYGAFGNSAPGNLLTAFDNPIWLIDIANLALVIHLVGAYQVYSQPLFAFVEEHASKRWPSLETEHKVEIPFLPSFKLNKLRLVWRSFFVVVTTFISMLVPFFNDIMGVIGALGFWPLTVYFPVEMYIKQMKIRKWSEKWIGLQCLSMFCLLVTLAALVGSVVGVLLDLSKFKAFSSQL
ncbi:amino acid permease 4-like [Arachis stenosperma]|uniref:amino acid permease 4-like n=1 Tax=Arachis stenosperma TaxID=217475 RepID=UPI0025AB6220|nr:amino acid permease 4-like [Arachis stenosperma]